MKLRTNFLRKASFALFMLVLAFNPALAFAQFSFGFGIGGGYGWYGGPGYYGPGF